MGIDILKEFIKYAIIDKLDQHEMILVAEQFIENKKKRREK